MSASAVRGRAPARGTPRRMLAAAGGAAAGILGAGAGELTAVIVAPGASPFAVIGSALIDLAPAWAKDTAIALFGTADKVALLIGIGLMLLVLTAVAGVAAAHRLWWGLVLVAALGVAGVAAALTRAGAGPFDAVPSAVGAVACGLALALLIGRMPQHQPAEALADPATATGVERRTFLIWTASTAALGILAAVSGSLVRTGQRTFTAVREAIRLPAVAGAASDIPAGADSASTVSPR